MEKTAGRILKADNVKLEGCFHLDAGRGASTSANGRNTNSVPLQARIVENNPEFTIIEVTCGCGAKTQIRCEYSGQSGETTKNNGEQK